MTTIPFAQQLEKDWQFVTLDESSLSMLHVDPDQQFEGRLFRRYAKSALLDLHSKLPYPGVRFHYQLHCQNEIVDIVCQSAPIVSLHRAVVEDKLASQAMSATSGAFCARPSGCRRPKEPVT
jgi:hypothetical protein